MNISLKQYATLLLKYLQPQRFRVAFLAFILLSSIGLELVNPQIVRYFIDAATSGSSSRNLSLAALAFIGIAIVQQGASILSTYWSENIGWTATNDLRVDLLAHCLGLDMTFHKTRRPGELIERVDADVTALSNFFSQFVVGVLGNGLLLVGVIVVLFLEDWRIGLAIGLFAAVGLYGMSRLRSIAVVYWKAMREMAAQFFGFVGEHLEATEDIRANGATAFVMRRLYELLREWFPIAIKATRGWYYISIANRAVFGLGTALALALGAYLWGAGLASIGTVYLVFYYIDLLGKPLTELRNQMQDLQAAGASISRVQTLFQTSPKIQDGPGEAIPSRALDVRFEHVSFRYEEGESVLQDLTFQLAPGRILGLLGRTGSGKSTLARLLFRLYDPTQGDICLGGVSIRAAHLGNLRGRVGMVTQEVQLFQATVRDNLTFFDHSIPDEQILRALRELELWTWYETLPRGLDSELQGGSGLSVGEAQLLAFARIFLRSPGLVVLDEASAHVDPGTERLIEHAIDTLISDRTGIIIAHRLATVQRADDIMILENGKIEEYGSRVKLMSDSNSRFSQLLRTGMAEVLA